MILLFILSKKLTFFIRFIISTEKNRKLAKKIKAEKKHVNKGLSFHYYHSLKVNQVYAFLQFTVS